MGTTEGTAQSRVQRKRGRRIQEILAVAAELFGERGYDAVSLDDVALDRLVDTVMMLVGLGPRLVS